MPAAEPAARFAAMRELMTKADLMTPMAIRVAAALGIVDHVSAGRDTAQALADATTAHPRSLRKLVDHLAAIEVLEPLPGGRYGVGRLGDPLLTGSAGPPARAALDPEHVMGRVDMAVTGMLDAVRTGRTSYESAHGRPVWVDLDRPDTAVPGLEALDRAAPALDADLVVHAYDWSRVGHVVDVGGNSGALLAALLAAHPHLRATLIDYRVFAELAAKRFERAGLAGRAEVVAGDFLDRLPAGGDVYLVSAILADWADADAVAILRRCAEAAGEQGRILLAEVHLTGQDINPFDPTAGALRLELEMVDPDRSAADLAVLAERAGLRIRWRADGRYRTVLELSAKAA